MFIRLLFLPNFLYFRKSVVKKLRVLRKGQKTGLVKLAYFQSSRGVHTLISQLKPKFNKSHFMNSALSIPRTFSCALDTFLEKKKHRVCFCHISQIKL